MGRGRRRAVMASAAAMLLLLVGHAQATVPPPPPRCAHPFVSLAPAPIAATQTAARLGWGEGAEASGLYYVFLRRPDGTTIQLGRTADDFGVLLSPEERVEAGPHLLEYGDACGGPIEPIALEFVASRTSPTRLGELIVEQEMYCASEADFREYPPPVRVRLVLDPDVEPWRPLLRVSLHDDTGRIDTQATRGPAEWKLSAGCGVLPSVPAGARTFSARALLPDGMTLEPATRAFEVRCPDCPRAGQSLPPDPAAWVGARKAATDDAGCSVARGGRDAADFVGVLLALAIVGARLHRAQRRS